MSSLAVTIEPLVIHPHSNADLLELAQVGLYRAVVGKGAYQTGEYGLYIPEQAIVPAELLDEIGLTGRLGGKSKDRVCTVRLRGEISQGIVCRPAKIAELYPDYRWDKPLEGDFAELLGITKWVPDIPVHMAGEVMPAPELLRWVDIENIRRYPTIFTPGEPVVATEKIHGTCCLFTYDARTGESFVTSKGFGEKNLALRESDSNVYWRAIRAYDIPGYAKRLADVLGVSRVGIFGEVYGQGVQDLGYATHTPTKPGYAVFDVRIEEDGEVYWVSHDRLRSLVRGDLPMVPILYTGPYDEELLLALAEGTETVSGTSAHIREGLVIRPVVERYSDVLGGRAIGKIVSQAYLTRKGGTEYE